MTNNHLTWKLIDRSEPAWNYPYEDFPSVAINDETSLRNQLASYARGKPVMLLLHGTSFGKLSLGLGGPFGVVVFLQGVSLPRMYAYADPIIANREMEFDDEGLRNSFPPGHLLATEDVINVVLHFYKTGKLASWIKWGPQIFDGRDE
jgi:hypothetical protein